MSTASQPVSQTAGNTPRFSEEIAGTLKSRLPEGKVEYVRNPKYADEDVVVLNHSAVLQAARILSEHFPFLMDICGVDYPGRDQRFDVVYHFADPEKGRRLRVKVRINDTDHVPSLTPVYKAANWFEREAFDMFGIKFSGHPNLRRILCHEDFVGHPLRKDYPAERTQELSTPMEHVFAKDR